MACQLQDRQNFPLGYVCKGLVTNQGINELSEGQAIVNQRCFPLPAGTTPVLAKAIKNFRCGPSPGIGGFHGNPFSGLLGKSQADPGGFPFSPDSGRFGGIKALFPDSILPAVMPEGEIHRDALVVTP